MALGFYFDPAVFKVGKQLRIIYKKDCKVSLHQMSIMFWTESLDLEANVNKIVCVCTEKSANV